MTWRAAGRRDGSRSGRESCGARLNRDDDEGPDHELPEDEVPDVDVTTRVRAKELRFGIVPEVKVWFAGEPGLQGELTDRAGEPA